VLQHTAKVIEGNTRAIEAVARSGHETMALIEDLRDQLLMRPCLRDQPQH